MPGSTRSFLPMHPISAAQEERRFLPLSILVIVTFVAFLPALQGGFISDDAEYVTENWTLRSVGGLYRIWFEPRSTPQYYPLVYTTFWVEYRIWRLNPLGYHIVNVSLHAFASILLWRLLRHLNLPGAWWAAAVFALHPVHVESVAWITERKNVLSGVFYFAALLSYFKYARETRGWRDYALSLSFFTCALFSKTVTCSLPAAALLILWWKDGPLRWRQVKPLIPFFVVGMSAGLMTAHWERQHGGAVGAAWDWSFTERCLIAGRAVWFYASKLVWPTDLTFTYPRWQIDPNSAAAYLFPLAAIVLVTGLWLLRRRIGKGPVTALLFFGGTLVPALGFFNIYLMLYSSVADHFQYHADVGLICLCVGTISRFMLTKRTPVPALMSFANLLLCAIVVVLGVLTWRQAHIYRDARTLWEDTLAKNPQAWVAHNNLGCLLAEEGALEPAMRHFEEVIKIHPGDELAHYNIGRVYDELGRTGLAELSYGRALAVRPDYLDAHVNLGILLTQTGNHDQALQHFQRALEINPNCARTHYNLGALFITQDRTADGVRHFREAIRINPDYEHAHMNLAGVLADEDEQGAIRHFYEALRVNSVNPVAHYHLARVLCKVGRIADGAAHYREALRIRPDWPAAESELSFILNHPRGTP